MDASSDPLKEITLSSEVMTEGYLLKAWRDTVRLPDGSTGIREYIKHPGAVVMVPLFPNGDTILIRQFRYAAGKSFIELPAGKLDGREPPEEAVQRELAEETGFRCGRMTLITTFYSCIGYSDERMWVYLTEDLTPVKSKSDEDEFIISMRLPFNEAIQMVYDGTIDDIKTMTSLLMADRHLQKQPPR